MSDTPSPHSPLGPATPLMDSQEDHDWSAFYDAEGRIYYFNSVTEQSSWDPPDNFNPPPPKDEEDAPEATDVGESEQQEAIKEEETWMADTGHANDDVGSVQGTWEAYKDDQGREYYFNSETGETQWEKPASMAEGEVGLSPERQQSPSAAAFSMDLDGEAREMKTEQKEATKQVKDEGVVEEVVEEVDPAVKAEEALNEPDAVMEPGCLNNVHELVTKYGGGEGGQKAMQALIASFHGQTAICGLLGRWLADLKAASSSSGVTKQEETFDTAADEVRGVVQDIVNRIAMERFSKMGGDNILNLSKAEAAFLEDMIDSVRWRKLLIDLSATNKDSALLMYCLQSISKRGHHREIAKRVNQSDHFAVYNAMLGSEFAVVSNLSASASSDMEASIDMNHIVADLRRACTSTSYTYLYAVELLRALLEKAIEKSASKDVSRLQGAIRKWERMSEELESAMVDPSISSTNAGSSTLFRKRRLDIAITIGELHQRQRRRHTPSSEGNGSDMGRDERRDELESALQNLLRRYSLGTPLDDRVLDKLLPVDGNEDSSNTIGKLLIAHPLSVKALLGQLFNPGSSRAASMVTRNKCARLIAFSVIAADSVVEKEPEDESESEESLAEKLTGRFLTGCQLCELLENMMTFEVISDPVIVSDDSSAGRKLCALALRSAPIAQGVIMWALEIANGPEFVTSASYPTLSPSILALVRVISAKHPFARRAALDVALVFLKHSNSELSYKVQNALKERCLRLLLFLLVKGDITAVLGSLTNRLRQQGTSEIDASLVRYFVGGLLDVLQPPYSIALIRELGPMLSAPKCMDALRSSYFGESNRKRLSELVHSFKDALRKHPESCTREDSGTVSTLRSIYCS